MKKAISQCWRFVKLEEVITSLEKGLIHEPSSTDHFVHVFHECDETKGRGLALNLFHAYMQKERLRCYQSLGNYLVYMLVEVGCINNAHQVFDRLSYRNDSSWNALIIGYVRYDKPELALDLYQQMMHSDESLHAYSKTFIHTLKACSKLKNLKQGRQIHVHVVNAGLLERDPFITSALVDMYAKCGSLSRAIQVFNKLPVRDRVSWTSLISGYVEHGDGKQALVCFEQMRKEGVSLDAMSYVCALKACGSLKSLAKGRGIHDEIERLGLLERNQFLCSILIDMYTKCSCLDKAQKVFDSLHKQDVVTWNALITGYNRDGHSEEALKLFEKMKLEGPSPDIVTFVSVLKACGNIGNIDQGVEIHREIERKGLIERDPVIRSSLIDMYASCDLEVAHDVLKKLPTRDVFSWTALISAYADGSYAERAVECYEQMKLEGISPNSVTYVCVLKACSRIGDEKKGLEIHGEIEQNGLLERDTVIDNALVSMYAKFGLFLKSEQVFDRMSNRTVVSWNTLIAGYAEHGRCKEALRCYEKMQLSFVNPDEVTYISSLKACGSIGAIEKGLEIHIELERQGLIERDHFVRSTLIDMYAKCGLLDKAREIFIRTQVQDVVSWNALITGYVEYECGEEALQCFERMRIEHVIPNAVTYLCSLKACVIVGAMKKGQEIHAEISRMGLLEQDVLVGNTLVDMYAKGGSLAIAEQVIDQLPFRDVVSWNALMSGYAQVGLTENVFDIFGKMTGEGIEPDPVTFIITLNACSRTGSCNKSQSFFEAMRSVYGIVPTLKHHTCVIDLLGRVGQLDKALTMVKNLPLSPNLTLWQAFIFSCNHWGNVSLGREAFEHAVNLDKKGASAYIFMSHMYAGTCVQDSTSCVSK